MENRLIKKNYAKYPRYFYYSNNKYDASIYIYIEKKCKNNIELYFYSPKYIICNRLYIAKYVYYLLKSVYLKIKNFVKRFNKVKVLYIYRQ